MLPLAGGTVTIDALGCSKAVAEQIVEAGADYLLALKGNQPKLHEEVEQYLLDAETDGFAGLPYTTAKTEERAHGRQETRKAVVTSVAETMPVCSDWPSLKSLVKVERQRRVGEQVQEETQLYISSLANLSAEKALQLVRNHWAVENGLHWLLDVAMHEDQCRVRGQNGAENFALIRRLVLDTLKRDKRSKRGIAGKMKYCSWTDEYLFHVLSLINPAQMLSQ